MLTIERLKEAVHYDPLTGVFTRLEIHRYEIGEIVPNPEATYYAITIDGKSYPAHRLAWFYMTGFWPRHQIDHIDRNPRNNKFINLRDITLSENTKNGRFKFTITNVRKQKTKYKKTNLEYLAKYYR